MLAADSAADGLGVAHLADEDDVGVLAEDPLEGGGVVLGVGADLPLVDQRPLVGVEDLDRVLDGHDVPGLRLVDRIDHRRDRRGLARPGGAGHQHQAPRLLGEAADDGRQPEGVERRRARQDPAQHQGHRVALAEDVDPEPAGSARLPRAVGEVGLAVAGELVGSGGSTA